jgi:hypothetical protein
MNKICPKCGKQLEAEQGFCDECGAAWTAPGNTAEAPIAAQPPAPQQPFAMPPPAAAKGSNKVLLVSLVVVVLVALGVGGWLLAGRRNARTAALAPPEAKPSASNTATASQTAPGGSQAAAVADTSNAVAALATTATDASATAAASKPCSLVSQADMEQILGMKVVKITSNETSCSYYTDATMSVDIDSTWTGGKEAMSAAKGYNANPGLFEPVAGIGDEAYMQAAGVLHVLKGDAYLVINSRQYPNEAQTESAMARKAMEKLK